MRANTGAIGSDGRAVPSGHRIKRSANAHPNDVTTGLLDRVRPRHGAVPAQSVDRVGRQVLWDHAPAIEVVPAWLLGAKGHCDRPNLRRNRSGCETLATSACLRTIATGIETLLSWVSWQQLGRPVTKKQCKTLIHLNQSFAYDVGAAPVTSTDLWPFVTLPECPLMFPFGNAERCPKPVIRIKRAKRLRKILHPTPRLNCFGRCFAGGRMFIPAVSRVEKPGRPVTSRLARTNGSGVRVRSQKSSAPNVPTVAFFRSLMK